MLSGFDQAKGMKEKHQLRISGPMDPATALDGSAMHLQDPTWLNHLSEGGGHYYGNIAELFAGFDGPDGDGLIGNKRPETVATPSKWGISWDTQNAMTEPWNSTVPVTTDPVPTQFFFILCSAFND